MTPAARPASTPEAFAVVRPCRTRITVAIRRRNECGLRAPTMPCVILDSAVYQDGQRDGGRPRRPTNLQDLRSEGTSPGDFVWSVSTSPTRTSWRTRGRLARPAPPRRGGRRQGAPAPKLERYEDKLFLVLKTLWYVDEADAVETGEIKVFVGHDFVVTVRHGHGSRLEPHERSSSQQAGVLTHGPSAVVYAVCDTVVDGYSAVVNELEVDVDEVEDSVFSRPGPTTRSGSTRSSGRSPRSAAP